MCKIFFYIFKVFAIVGGPLILRVAVAGNSMLFAFLGFWPLGFLLVSMAGISNGEDGDRGKHTRRGGIFKGSVTLHHRI